MAIGNFPLRASERFSERQYVQHDMVEWGYWNTLFPIRLLDWDGWDIIHGTDALIANRQRYMADRLDRLTRLD